MRSHTPYLSTPDKRAHASATIRGNREEADHKTKKSRNRPAGILPTRIAKVERHIEGLCVAMDCSCCMGKWERVYEVSRAMLEQNELHLERGEIKMETFARHFRRLMELQRLAGVEMRARKKRLDDVEIPELRNLCTQAERAA